MPPRGHAACRHWTSTKGGWYVANGDAMPLGDTATPGDPLPSPKLSSLLFLSSTVSGIPIGAVAVAGRSLTGEGPVDGGGIDTCSQQPTMDHVFNWSCRLGGKSEPPQPVRTTQDHVFAHVYHSMGAARTAETPCLRCWCSQGTVGVRTGGTQADMAKRSGGAWLSVVYAARTWLRGKPCLSACFMAASMLLVLRERAKMRGRELVRRRMAL